MTTYDIFNGDADGICALHQLRLAHPTNSRLITGVKRDIHLLRKVFPDRGDSVTVLDISLDSNRADLIRILDLGTEVTYFDHHFSGIVPEHELLKTYLSSSKDVCTSLLVDDFVQGAYRLWAIVGAFGDNLDSTANQLGTSLLDENQMNQLRELGRLLNYNSYGKTVEDLHFVPDHLYQMMHSYLNPFDFITTEHAFLRLREGYNSDMAKAFELKPEIEAAHFTIYVLPNEAWSRRVSGVMANHLIRRWPDKSHAVIVPNTPSCYMVGLRVSENSSLRADEFCRQFDSGGGRATAGGINHLPRQRLDDFFQIFQKSFS
jgi:hypothetical protein